MFTARTKNSKLRTQFVVRLDLLMSLNGKDARNKQGNKFPIKISKIFPAFFWFQLDHFVCKDV